LLDDFQEGFDDFGGMGLGMAKLHVNGVNDVGFGKGHGGGAFWFFWGS